MAAVGVTTDLADSGASQVDCFEAGRRSRSRSRGDDDATLDADTVVQAARAKLDALCKESSIPPSHGLEHAARVLRHAENALAAAAAAPVESRALAVRLAALLHDADDRKYFPDCPKNTYPNARLLMKEAGAPESVVKEALEMIGQVSCSANGNSIPPKAEKEPEWLWPRWADRLEATGEIGVVRCWQFSTERGEALSVSTTPRPTSEDEIWALSTHERFEAYQKSGGQSNSMLDHYYDKLLQVARPPKEFVQNHYLEAEMTKQAAPLVQILLSYGRAGEVPLEEIRAMAARLEATDA
jgi:uncharacterized protein